MASDSVIPLPPTMAGLGPLLNNEQGQIDDPNTVKPQAKDSHPPSSDLTHSPTRNIGESEQQHNDPNSRLPFSPIKPHPNATADETSQTLAGDKNHVATEHVAGEGYSASNKVPTIQQFRKDQEAHRNEAESQAQSDDTDNDQQTTSTPQPVQGDGKSYVPKENTAGTVYADRKKANKQSNPEKDELMHRMAPDKRDKPNHINKGGSRTWAILNQGVALHADCPDSVTDPVTGLPVKIDNSDKLGVETMKLYDVRELDPQNDKHPGPALQKAHGDSKGPSTTDVQDPSPQPVRPGNILLQQFPPPIEAASIANVSESIDKVTYGVGAGLGVIWMFVAFGHGFFALLFRTFLIGSLGVGIFMLNGLTKKNIEHGIERVRIDMHRQRGEKFSPPTPESVEWLNAILGSVWRLINPDMFVSSVDMVEDVMQASLPSFVDAIKISDYGQGSNPVRIISMRGLPDRSTDKDYPKEEWIDQGKKDEATNQKTQTVTDENMAKTKEEQDLDEAGDYVNLEVAIAYQARPGQNLRSHNIHLLLEFFLGFYDWFEIPIPIWAQVEGFAATIRLRMQMVPDAPFVRNLTFTLMGIPKVDVSVQPMISHFPNVLDLPIISGFVQSSIAAAAAEYVAPKSMTLNLAQMISGGGIKKDTKALGVLAITIHHAENLSSQDSNGKSDPYIVLAYAKFGKPQYSTRIIIEDLNPVFEETAFLLLTDDEVKAGEDLALMLWDSDKRSADDLIGRITVPVVDLMLKPNQVFERTDPLQGFQDAEDMQGQLTWSVAFYDKAPFNDKLKRSINYDLPPEIRDRPELQDHNDTAADTQAESDAMQCPPDPAYPAGIVSVIVHQINNLERQNLKGASGSDREGAAGQDTDAPAEEGGNLASSYCEIVLNDELIYKTRVKQFSSQPFFEAGCERFVRDWRSAVVRVVVRDSRLREHDPIMGIVSLRIRDILSTSSQVTRLYAIQDGVGFGRVNISLLFRSVEANIPRSYLGWNTGTIEVLSDIVYEPADGHGDDLKTHKLKMSTSEGHYKIKSSHVHKEGDHATWKLDETVRLPVYDRYASSLNFELGPGTKVLGLGTNTYAVASLWFQDLIDDEEDEVRIPLIVGENLASLKLNVLNQQTAKSHDYKIVGYLKCRVKLDSGLDPDHAKYAHSQKQRHEFETYQNAEGLVRIYLQAMAQANTNKAEMAEQNSHAADDGVIDKQEQKQIDKARKQQLHSQHRGVYQVPIARTAVWTKDGVKDRLSSIKKRISGNKHRDDGKAVESEA